MPPRRRRPIRRDRRLHTYARPDQVAYQLRRRRLHAPLGQRALLVSTNTDPHDVAEAAWLLLDAYGGVWNRADIQRELRLSRTRVAELTNQKHFPDPIGEVGARPVWLAVDVQRYREDPPTRWTTATEPSAPTPD